MTLKLSPAIQDMFPGLEWLLAQTRSAACKRDRAIKVRDLRVDVRRHPYAGRIAGLAYPSTTSYRGRGRSLVHLDGRILLSLGEYSSEPDIIAVFAHELRHIGQFHRGLKRYGYLTIRPMTDPECEADAESFATDIVEGLSYLEINPFGSVNDDVDLRRPA